MSECVNECVCVCMSKTTQHAPVAYPLWHPSSVLSRLTTPIWAGLSSLFLFSEPRKCFGLLYTATLPGLPFLPCLQLG